MKATLQYCQIISDEDGTSQFWTKEIEVPGILPVDSIISFGPMGHIWDITFIAQGFYVCDTPLFRVDLQKLILDIDNWDLDKMGVREVIVAMKRLGFKQGGFLERR